MVYYLTNAPQNKADLTAYGIQEGQLNIVLRMMKQCRVLRQGKVIETLLRESLPEGFEMVYDTIVRNDGEQFQQARIQKKV